MEKINLQKIVSIKANPGLYHLVSHNKKGFFVQPFQGGQTVFIANERDRVLAIGNVDLKCNEGSINVLDLLKNLDQQNSIPEPDAEPDEILNYFFELIPNLDRSVRHSHLVKVLKWRKLILAEYSPADIINEEVDNGLTIV